MHFVRGDGQVLYAFRDDGEFAFVHPRLAVAQAEQQTAFHHKEELVLALVVMPHELALQLHELDVRIVQFARDLRAPVVIEQTELLRQVHASHRASPDRKSTRLNSSHGYISYAVFCLKKKKT